MKRIPENIFVSVLFTSTRFQTKTWHIFQDIYQQQKTRKIPQSLSNVCLSRERKRKNMGMWKWLEALHVRDYFCKYNFLQKYYASFEFQLTYSHYIYMILSKKICYIFKFMFWSYVTFFKKRKHLRLWHQQTKTI